MFAEGGSSSRPLNHFEIIYQPILVTGTVLKDIAGLSFTLPARLFFQEALVSFSKKMVF